MTMRRIAALCAAAAVLASAGLTAAPSPAGAAGPVKITAAYYDPFKGPDPNTTAGRNQEYIVLRNNGTKAMKLGGWKLHDVPRAGVTNTFKFPAFTLRPGKSVRIHTGAGSNTATDLYWGKSFYVWGDDADKATLQNRAGSIVSTCAWTSTDTSPKYC